MPTMSVLTAVHPPGAGFLDECRESILTQQLPPGWDVEWVVQEDGPASDIQRRVEGSRVKYSANGAKFGLPITRNFGLARVSGVYVQSLDADDLLLPGALANGIRVLEEHSNVHWFVGQADDLMPDGTRVTFPPYMPLGLTAAGAANQWAVEHGGNWPVHGAGMMYRTATVRAAGGWGAVPTDEDLVMFAGISQVTDGWQDQALTWLYRQHSNQVTRSNPTWTESPRRIALQRARAAQAAGLALAGTDDDPDIVSVAVAPLMKSSAAI